MCRTYSEEKKKKKSKFKINLSLVTNRVKFTFTGSFVEGSSRF